MGKYVISIFIFVAIVAIAGFLINEFYSNNLQGAAVYSIKYLPKTTINRGISSQSGAAVFVTGPKEKTTKSLTPKTTARQQGTSPYTQIQTGIPAKKSSQPAQKYAGPSKTSKSGLVITNGLPYQTTPMSGIVMIKGLSISVNLLIDKGVQLQSGFLITPEGKEVQIKDVEMRRKPVKLQFKN